MKNPAEYAKAIVAILGAVVTAIVAQFPSNPNVQLYGSLVLSIVTAVSVYLVPNASAPVDETEPLEHA